jgi:hypothetical protein
VPIIVWNVSTNFSKTPQYQVPQKFIQVFLSFCEQTDKARLLVAVLQFLVANAPKESMNAVCIVMGYIRSDQYMV